MLSYRVYVMHPERIRVLRYEEFVAPNDATALEEAASYAGDKSFYLWSGTRRVQPYSAEYLWNKLYSLG